MYFNRRKVQILAEMSEIFYYYFFKYTFVHIYRANERKDIYVRAGLFL